MARRKGGRAGRCLSWFALFPGRDMAMRYLTAGCCAWLICGLNAAAEDAPPPKAITWELIIAEAPDAETPPATADAPSAAAILELEKAGKLTWFARFRLTGLENQPASIKFGELTPVVTGRNVSSVGR